MTYCIEVSAGPWAFVLLLAGLSGLLLLGVGAVAVMERRAARKQRLRPVRVGAVRVVPRSDRPAANSPDHGSWDQ